MELVVKSSRGKRAARLLDRRSLTHNIPALGIAYEMTLTTVKKSNIRTRETYKPVKAIAEVLQLITMMPERRGERHDLLSDVEQLLAVTQLP